LPRSLAADTPALLGQRTFHHRNDDDERKHRNGEQSKTIEIRRRRRLLLAQFFQRLLKCRLASAFYHLGAFWDAGEKSKVGSSPQRPRRMEPGRTRVKKEATMSSPQAPVPDFAAASSGLI
jgi:hypothetical protein